MTNETLLHGPDDAHLAEHLAEPSPVDKVRDALGDPSGIRRALILLAWLITAVGALQLAGLGLILYGQVATHNTQQTVTACTTPSRPGHPHKCYDDANRRTAAAVGQIVTGIVAGLRAPPGVVVIPVPATTTTTTTVPAPAARSQAGRSTPASSAQAGRAAPASSSTPTSSPPPSQPPSPQQPQPGPPAPRSTVCIGTFCINVPTNP